MSYQYGKIYRIVVGDSYYSGSTTMSLDERLLSHKYMSKKHPEMKLYKKAIELGLDAMTIELVEHYPCNSKTELLQRENMYINLSDPLCLNMRLAYLSPEEKKQIEKEWNRNYRLNHLAQLRQKNKEYKATRPPLTEEEKEARRTYHREYMRRRRAKIAQTH